MIAKKYGVNCVTNYKKLLQKKPEFAEMTMPPKLQREMPEDAIKKVCYISLRKHS